MSTWRKLKLDDVELDLENEEINLLIDTNDNGNNYVTVSLEIIQEAIDLATIATVTSFLKRLGPFRGHPRNGCGYLHRCFLLPLLPSQLLGENDDIQNTLEENK